MNLKIINIEEILLKYGALPSSQVKKHLLEAGLSEEAARQRISRAKVRKSFLKLPKNESFLYLDKQYGNEAYWNAFLKAHMDSNSAYGNAISSILARGNAIPSRYFNIVSGSPKKLSKHLSSSSIKNNLIKANIITTIADEEFGEFLAINPNICFKSNNISEKKISLFVEDIIVNAVADWLKKIGLGSYNAIKKRDEENIPFFGSFEWDITAPSYIYPLCQKNKNSLDAGFVVADVINEELDINDVKYFINKCKTNRQFKKMKPFFAFLIAKKFTKEAFKIGKQEGVIFTTPEILFGGEIAKSLADLADTLKNAAAVAATNPNKLIQLLNSLGKIEGSAINLRGALFELIVGHLVLIKEGNSIDIGVKVYSKNGKAEIDVRRVKGEFEVALYECKGKQPTTEITEEDIKCWQSKIAIIRESLLLESRFNNSKMIFEYWTSGVFSNDALKLLEEMSEKTKKYDIKWKDGKDVILYAREAKLTSMVEVLNQHYMKHPLS